MDRGGFYETVAQVLPTLLVAVILEIRWLISAAGQLAERSYRQYGQATVDNAPPDRRREQRLEYHRWHSRATRSTWLYLTAAGLFLVGELAACLEIYLDGPDHGSAVVVWPALIGLTMLAVVVPLLRSGDPQPEPPTAVAPPAAGRPAP